MPAGPNYLGPEALRQVEDLVRRTMHSVQGGGYGPRGDRPSEGYVFAAKSSTTITPRSSNTAGTGTAQLYHLSTAGVLTAGSTTHFTVKNLNDATIDSAEFILLKQDVQGTLWVETQSSTVAIGGGSSDVVLATMHVADSGAQIVSSSVSTATVQLNRSLYAPWSTDGQVTFQSTNYRLAFNGTYEWLVEFAAFIGPYQPGFGALGDLAVTINIEAGTSTAFSDVEAPGSRATLRSLVFSSSLNTFYGGGTVGNFFYYRSSTNSRYMKMTVTKGSTTALDWQVYDAHLMVTQMHPKG